MPLAFASICILKLVISVGNLGAVKGKAAH